MATDPILDAPRDIAGLHRLEPIQKATWRLQRAGWWVLLLITVAGLSGLLGGGPLATTQTQTAAARIEYDMLLRRQADFRVAFHIPAPGGRAELTLPAPYMEAVEISRIEPAPVAAFAAPHGQTFLFLAPHEQAEVRLTLRAHRIGPLEFTPVVNGRAVPTRHPLVLP